MENKLIKSPMNYTGGKYKLLPQILPLFPTHIDTFVDLFCGGLNVGINVTANKVIANDICKEVIDVYNGIKKSSICNSLNLIKNQINKYDLSKTNQEGYNSIRKYYNDGNKEWYIFYALLTHSFNNQIRFNKNGCYNMPFGKNRSSFNPTLEKHFIKFANALIDKNIKCTSENFYNFKIDNLNENDFVYLDPPYLITCASYNENDGWNNDKEHKLLELCDKLNDKNIKFALSNVLEHKGIKNDILIEWAKRYNVHRLNYNYNNCNYQVKDKTNNTVEVLITNY